MYIQSSIATLLMAGSLCPPAPAKYNEVLVVASVPTINRQVKFERTSMMVSDYAKPSDQLEADDPDQNQVGGADLTPAVWYHTPDVPIIFSDVAYHKKHHRSKKKSAAIVGGSAATGAAIGALAGGGKGAVAGGLVGAGAGYVYDHNTKKK
jgi:hypothetical protein